MVINLLGLFQINIKVFKLAQFADILTAWILLLHMYVYHYKIVF